MQKILELTEKEFATGIAPGSQVQNQGLWYKAKGITVIREPFLESDNAGLLQAAPSPTDLTGSVIVDIPWAWATDVSGTSTKHLYIWGNAGHLYKIDISGDNDPTDVSSGAAVSNPAAGVFVFTHSTGAKYVYYMQLTQIGRWDPTAAWATRTSNYYTTNISSTAFHGTHRFLDREFFCNLNYIGTAEDDGAGGLTVTPRALDFEAGFRTNCLSDDGTYLVAGITTNQANDNLTHGRTKIIFWDTNQSSWQKEWIIHDAAILSIKRVGDHMEAVTSRGVYAFTFDIPPKPLLPLLQATAVPAYTYPGQFAADVFGGAVLFGGAERVSSFGKLSPHLPTAYFQPFAGFTGDVTLVISTAKTNDVFVGTASSKLYRAKLTAAGQTGVAAETIFIDLKRWWQVGKVVAQFEGQLASGDNFNVDLQPDSSVSVTDFGSATFATHGAIRTREFYKTLEARKLKLILNFVGGAVRVRNIQVWGDPIEVPTHTRA